MVTEFFYKYIVGRYKIARPQKIYSYQNINGITCQRGRCIIEGCNCLRTLNGKYRDDGTFYRYELTTCCKHRKDGGTFRCNDPDKRREQIWRAQGIKLAFSEYQQIHAFQDGKCALCGTSEKDLKDVLFVDHCHTTGKIRGLICKRCNGVLAWMENFTSLDVIRQFLGSDVFTRYKGLLVENPEMKKSRK